MEVLRKLGERSHFIEQLGVARGHSASAYVGFDASAVPAITLWSFGVDTRVPPLSSDCLPSDNQLSTVDDAYSTSSAKDGSENQFVILACSIKSFGEGKTVSVVLNLNRTPQGLLEINFQRATVQAQGAGVFHQLRPPGDSSRSANAERMPFSIDALAQSVIKRSDAPYDVVVTLLLFCRDALATNFVALIVEHDAFDLSAAKVDA
jgi:hypothetical protein